MRAMGNLPFKQQGGPQQQDGVQQLIQFNKLIAIAAKSPKTIGISRNGAMYLMRDCQSIVLLGVIKKG